MPARDELGTHRDLSRFIAELWPPGRRVRSGVVATRSERRRCDLQPGRAISFSDPSGRWLEVLTK